LTTDEDLNRLEENLRRLRVEYESYFSGGLPRPPRDSAYRVESALKRLSENMGEFNLRQRYRFNQLQQKYMVYGGLWRKRLRDLEEGRGRRTSAPTPEGPFRIVLQAPEAETEKVNQIFDTWMNAKRQMGEPVPAVDRDVFAQFVQRKSEEIKQKLGCASVGFCVKVEEGRVKLKAGRG